LHERWQIAHSIIIRKDSIDYYQSTINKNKLEIRKLNDIDIKVLLKDSFQKWNYLQSSKFLLFKFYPNPCIYLERPSMSFYQHKTNRNFIFYLILSIQTNAYAHPLLRITERELAAQQNCCLRINSCWLFLCS